jgi:hypothetical protein
MNDVIPTENAVAVRSASPFDGNVAEFKGALIRRGENRLALIQWVRSSLVDGTDFGRIHTKKKSECQHRGPPVCNVEKEPYHWSKNTLFKPGAEKICGMLGVTATFPTIKDYEQAALGGVPIESIILRCHLLSADGSIIADGIGARSVAQDYGNLNTALKMACKSAHIDATLRMAGLSEIFTQDLEDMHPPAEAATTEPKREAAPTPTPAPPPSTGGRGFATEKQIKLIRYRIELGRLDERSFKEHFSIEHWAQLPFAKVNDCLAMIQEWTDGQPGN